MDARPQAVPEPDPEVSASAEDSFSLFGQIFGAARAFEEKRASGASGAPEEKAISGESRAPEEKAIPADELPIRLGGGSTPVLFWKSTSNGWGGNAVKARKDAEELVLPTRLDPSEAKGDTHLPLSGWSPPPKPKPKPKTRPSRKRLTTTQAFARPSIVRPRQDPPEPSPQPPPEPPPQGLLSVFFGQHAEAPLAEEPPPEPPVEPPPEPPPAEPPPEPDDPSDPETPPKPELPVEPSIEPLPAWVPRKERPQPPPLWSPPRQPEPEAPEEWEPEDASDTSDDVQPGKAPDTPPPPLWDQSKDAVKDLRAVAAEACSPAAVPETGFSFAPAVALRLMPGYQGEIHTWSPPKPEPVRRMPRLKVYGDTRQQETLQSKGPPTYQQVLAAQQAAAPRKAAVVPIRMDYQSMCRSQLGPASLQLGASLPIEQFRKNMLSTCGDYTAMSHDVTLPAEKPEFRDLIEHFDVEFDGAGRPWGQMDRVNLLKAFEENKEIRKKLMRDGLSMRPAIPKPKEDLSELVGHQASGDELHNEREQWYGRGQESERPPRPRALDAEGEGWYYKIKLDIVIVKAINVPENVGLFQCDPYVQVTVLDGNPFSEEALAGGDGWYRMREQWFGETPVLQNTTQPEWRHRLEAEIRPREGTFIHLKLLDQDLAALKDRGVGHCAVPISEVQKDHWHGVRPIALEPFDTKKAKDWAGLVDCRLFFSVGWEGSAARVKHKMQGFKKASGQLGDRVARRKVRSRRTTPTSAAVSFADVDERVADVDELLDAAPARPAETMKIAELEVEETAETWEATTAPPLEWAEASEAPTALPHEAVEAEDWHPSVEPEPAEEAQEVAAAPPETEEHAVTEADEAAPTAEESGPGDVTAAAAEEPLPGAEAASANDDAFLLAEEETAVEEEAAGDILEAQGSRDRASSQSEKTSDKEKMQSSEDRKSSRREKASVKEKSKSSEKKPTSRSGEKKSTSTSNEKRTIGTSSEKKPASTSSEKKPRSTSSAKKPTSTSSEKKPTSTNREKKAASASSEKKQASASSKKRDNK